MLYVLKGKRRKRYVGITITYPDAFGNTAWKQQKSVNYWVTLLYSAQRNFPITRRPGNERNSWSRVKGVNDSMYLSLERGQPEASKPTWGR